MGQSAATPKISHLRRPRLAKTVAAELREQIVSGMIKDGDSLPTMGELMDAYGISGPSIREAYAILENEGLITVRRGNVGGAVVHTPKAETAAYTLGLVLQSRNASVSDIARALGQLEPLCARLCAERPDREVTVLVPLMSVNTEMEEAVDDPRRYVRLASEFHRTIPACCGNESLRLVVGSLEWLWSTQPVAWLRRASLNDEVPDAKLRQQGIVAHREIVAAIESGNGSEAERLVRDHVSHPDTYWLADDDSQVVRATELREGSAALLRPSIDCDDLSPAPTDLHS